MTKIRHYSSTSDRVLFFLLRSFSTFFVLIILLPIVFIVCASLSSPAAISAGVVYLWPVDFTVIGYRVIFDSPLILRGFTNSILYTVLGTTASLILTILAAYPLSRKDFKVGSYVMLLFAFTMFFSGGMIPTYMVVRSFGLIDTIWAMVFPGAVGVWNIIIMKTYFQTNIPKELYESATIDGASDIRFLVSIAVPLAVPIIAVMVLLFAVGRWNSFMDALIYLNDPKLKPIQITLRSILISNTAEDISFDLAEQQRRTEFKYLLQYSLIIVASLPMLVLYPFIQKYFIKGILVGSIKG